MALATTGLGGKAHLIAINSVLFTVQHASSVWAITTFACTLHVVLLDIQTVYVDVGEARQTKGDAKKAANK